MARSRSYAERVNVLKKVQVDGVWKFVPALVRRGKIVRDHVVVAGQDQHHPEGSYYIEWYEISKRRKQCVGDFADVLAAARRKSFELKARQNGMAMVDVVQANNGNGHSPSVRTSPSPNGRLTKDAALDQYLAYIKANRSSGTYKAYRFTLGVIFRASFTKAFVDEAAREDILQFIAFCADRGNGSRTIYDKVVIVLQFLKQNGITKLISQSDWPKYVETIRVIYEPEEIEALLKTANDWEKLRIKFFLASGFRDKEVRFLCWQDIDFRNNLARVTKKPRWKFLPKNYEERAVPLPTTLIQELRKLREETNGVASELVFPNTRGNPKDDHLDMVKKVARRAKLNCGQCETEHGNKCLEGPHCMRFFLHKFRHTYATEHLRHGIDIRTLQAWLGHRDIQSTMVYLKGVHSKDALAKVDAGALARYVA